MVMDTMFVGSNGMAMDLYPFILHNLTRNF